MELALPGKRKRGRPAKRWLDCVADDMQSIGAVEGMHDGKRWNKMVASAAIPHGNIGVTRRRR